LESALFALGAGRELSKRQLLLVIALPGAGYGLVMGSFACDSLSRARLMLYGALKVPLLLLGTAALCLPAYFALNTIGGVRRHFATALQAVFASQAAVACALVSLGPLTAFLYLSGIDHDTALLVNAAAFGSAAIMGQLMLRRRYRWLIEQDTRHRYLLSAWFTLYAFVGIQMGWLLRPFVGSPDLPVTFFRSGAFSNAYVVVIDLVLGIFH